MSDPYRLTGDTENPHQATSDGSPVDVMQTLIWVLLVVSAVANAVTSFGGVPIWIHLGAGLVTAFCVAALIALYLRRRR
jgi:hypothetical protein